MFAIRHADKRIGYDAATTNIDGATCAIVPPFH